MKKYPKYKDSSVVGEIPTDWRATKLKYIGFLYGGLTGKSGEDFRRDDDPNNRYFIPFTNISNNFYISPSELKPVYFNVQEVQNEVKKGDIFFLMSSETQEDIGKTAVLKKDLNQVYLNSFCKGFRIIDHSVDSCFLNYLLRGDAYRQLLSIEGNGFTRINLRQDRVTDFTVFIPCNLEEQHSIVSFLDEKTTEIDQLISNSQNKINLLKEKRTALINHAVTKGLDPKAKMKDSGVEWIGEIPEKFKMTRVGYLGDLLTGNPWPSDSFNHERGIKIVRGENVSEGFLRWGDRTRYWSHEVIRGDLYYLCDGDIVVSMDGSKVGKNYVRIIATDLPLLLHQRMCRIRPSLEVNSRFLEYCIGSDLFQYYINISKTDPLIPHITQKDIFDYLIVLPPIELQKETVRYLDNHTFEIDKEVSLEERRIELLKEYRQSLISEVVTGKINVLDYAD